MSSPLLFDQDLRRRRWQARPPLPLPELADIFLTRLDDIKKEFSKILILGPAPEGLSAALAAKYPDAVAEHQESFAENLDCAPHGFDLILWGGEAHWVNDLPGFLMKIQKALKPDGVFLLALWGGDSFYELRDVFMRADLACYDGASPRIMPCLDLSQLGQLAQRAGFTLPVLEVLDYALSYENLPDMLADLRHYGAYNILYNRRQKITGKKFFQQASEIYEEVYPHEEGGICLTLQLYLATLWAPHPDQPRALKPGSATIPLADVLLAKDHQEFKKDS